jgi:GTPase SAR1 family protein
MISSYYRGAHGIIIVFDYTNIKSFYSLKNWMKEIKTFANEDCIKYLVCNKADKSINETSSTNTWIVNEQVFI